MDRLENKQLVLEELRKAYDRKYSASDVLDGKLQNIFSFLSVVVAIAPTLEVMINPDPNKIGVLFLLLLFCVLALYYVSFRKVVSILRPITYRQPISKNWDDLVDDYFEATKEQVANRTINEYLISLDDTGEKNNQKILVIHQVSKLMGIIVILLLLAIPVNMFFPAPTLSGAITFLHQWIQVKP